MEWYFLILLYPLSAIVLWAITWVFYLAGMAVLNAGSKATSPAKVIAPIAELLSTTLNWYLFTVVLLEFPKEKFLSTRLARHKRSGSGWRYKIATKLGDIWLDPYDPSGKHI